MFVRSIEQTFALYTVTVPESGCWLWIGGTDKDGYGSFVLNGKRVKAHRASFAHHVGPIPDGINVLHKCDTPSRVNPEHLFLGTQAVNILDCLNKGRQRNQNKGRTHCKNGHELAGDNVKTEVTGFRRCVTCRREYHSQYDARRKENV